MNALELVKLPNLMEQTHCKSDVAIGLIDGPVAMNHADLGASNMRTVPGTMKGTCTKANSSACLHGTFVAGILCAKRGSGAPAICPGCTLLVRPIFAETTSANGDMPSAKPEELAEAILDCLRVGAHVLNLSAAIAQPSSKSECALEEALDQAATARRDRGGGGREPRNARSYRHHPASLDSRCITNL